MMVEVAAVGVWLAGLWRAVMLALCSPCGYAILALTLIGSERRSRIGATSFLTGCDDSERDRRPPLRAGERFRVCGLLLVGLLSLVSCLCSAGWSLRAALPRVAALCAKQPVTRDRRPSGSLRYTCRVCWSVVLRAAALCASQPVREPVDLDAKGLECGAVLSLLSLRGVSWS